MLIESYFHANAGALGVFDSSIGLGILAGSLVFVILKVSWPGWWFISGFALETIGMVCVGIAPAIWMADVGNFLLGLGIIYSGIPLSTLFQLHTPNEIRGQVHGFTSALFNLSIPLTYGAVGLLGNEVGARISYQLGAAILMICTLAATLTPSLRRAKVVAPGLVNTNLQNTN